MPASGRAAKQGGAFAVVGLTPRSGTDAAGARPVPLGPWMPGQLGFVR